MELNQIVLYLERLANENQTDHIDWGFRISALYGLDYRFMTHGLFSSPTVEAQQLLRFRHADDLSRPLHSLRAQGMNIRIGRIISEPDIEAQLAPNNLMASHSLLYGFDTIARKESSRPRKSTINGRFKPASPTELMSLIWQEDPGRQVTGTVMIQWISPNQMDSIYAGDK